MKEAFTISTIKNDISATDIKMLSLCNDLDSIRRSKLKFNPEDDLLHHLIPKDSNRICRVQGNPIRCLYLGTIKSSDKIYLIMDMDVAYIVHTDDFNTINEVTTYKGYNPFKDIPFDEFTINPELLYNHGTLYNMPLSKAVHDFIVHGGRYVILTDRKNHQTICPTICKQKNIEDVSVYTYKMLGSTVEYTPPFIEYVNGRFARIIQIVENQKVSLDEHDMKSDSELRWVTSFRWPSVKVCINSLMQYGLITDYFISTTLKLAGCISDHIFTVRTKNGKMKSFVYDPVKGYMTLIL